MKLWPKHTNQAGDTIVEVLIAVAVISSVLIGAFAVSQKGTLAVRDSQEHGEMLQVLQGQVELVRSLALAESDPAAGVFDTSPKYFCIDNSNPAAPVRADFPAGFVLPAADTDPYNYPAKCKNLQGRYNVAITYDTNIAASKVFRFYGRWDRVGGHKNQEQLVYRIYPGTAP